MADSSPPKWNLLHALNLPEGFFEFIIRDIPVTAWTRMLEEAGDLRKALFEGFSLKPEKFARHLQRPELRSRLKRCLRIEPRFLHVALELWGIEHLALMACLEMLDASFIHENFSALKNLFGPERFFAGLYLLDELEDDAIREQITAQFWERNLDAESIEPLVPFFTLWQELLAESPQAAEWLAAALPEAVREPAGNRPAAADHHALRKELHGETERRHKLEQKLARHQEENSRLLDQLHRLRQDNETLRLEAARWQQEFDTRLQTAVAGERNKWFERYQTLDQVHLWEANQRLETLLTMADKAFALQSRADEEYGSVAEISQKLLRVELYLWEIERIYRDSLVVHPEIARVKEALLKTREKILAIPGIEKVFDREPDPALPDRLRQQLHLLDPLPHNLHRVLQLEEVLNRLAATGWIDETNRLISDVAHKKRQIMETVYARFNKNFERREMQPFHRNLDDLVRSGAARRYWLFVDGYNILLQVRSGGSEDHPASLAAMRQQFIAALARKSQLFKRVLLVFDGIEESHDKLANMEILYTDKTRGQTADAAIVALVRKRKEKEALLVTADREIIAATESQLYGVIDPYHFYAFVFDLEPPLGW